ncbi:NTP transferase domain-containing protein [Chengkuizengella axinellae]|uniref:NTP transferase domain-containing protein n=1 Tax=Chengkuizengella axinellae TaxID=3064388 RepID=A0ABT9J3V0_9BACL|nr:NTP transferase domain-containing protein [Chengkuizengella sp. 2205SS18-9]MDP5276243.1 NTP transferase domain-containing protein [Chengkuizengella sp. 2205SS18-9]
MKNKQVIGIYLAAGKSSRMGCNKLKLPLDNYNETLGSIAFKVALHSSLDHLIVVTNEEDSLGWSSPTFLSAPYRSKWTHLRCKSSAEGQSGSIKCGLHKALELKPEAIMIMLADQPFITVEMINSIIDEYMNQKSAYFIASSYQNTIRPPILCSHKMFRLLMHLEGDKGARYILRKKEWREKGIVLHFENPIPFLDVDTIEDYLYANNIKGTLE